MYQGKFASNKGGKQADINADMIAERNNAKELAAAKMQAATARRAQAAAVRNGVPAQKAAPQAASRPAPQKAQPAAAQAAKKAPARQSAPAPAAIPEKKKGSRTGTTIFYTVYFLFIAIFMVGTFLGLQWLKGWLADYEAAQPTAKSEEVFQQYFGNPNWAELYKLAGVEDTAYEGSEEYVAYMNQKVGSQKLDYMETSAGLSGDKKYFVKLGSEKIASFTLQGESKYITDIPDWQLGKIDLFFGRDDGYLIQKLNGHTAYVNGVALDDSFTIQIATTKAEDYLPIGTSGIRTDIQKIDNLMALPEVTVTNAEGEQMEVVYDEEKGMFIEQTSENTIGSAEEAVCINAAKAYGQYMIRRADRGDVAKYFDPSSNTYNIIVKSELFSTTNNGCRFSDESVTEYCRYSNNLFSARVKITMNVIRTDGTIKDYDIDTTLFFMRKNENSNWIAFDMTNEDVQQPVGKVRLTFKVDDTVLMTDFFETNSHTVQTPTVTAPEGKVFSGWVHETVDANGQKTLVVEFPATEDGIVSLAAGYTLEPMTLTALFEDAATGVEG